MKKHKRKKERPLEVYLGNLERFIKKGLADVPIQLNDAEVQVGYEILYSKHSQRCYYYVKAMPEYIASSFYSAVRSALRVYSTTYPVFIHFRVQGVPHVIDWNSAEMKQRRRNWENYERTKEVSDSRFADSKTRATNQFEEWRMKSWDYIQGAEDRKVQLIDCEVTVELSVDGITADHKHSLLDMCKEFEQWCAKQNIKIKKVRGNIPNFLRYTGLTSLDKKVPLGRQITNRVLSSEILARMISYVPGRIDDVGVLFGIDIMTGMAVYKNMVRPNGDAENFLVMAKTGGGKSFYMKAVCFHMMLNGFHQVVLDIDGEYIPFAKETGGIIINMSKAAGLYFDSTIIGDLTGNKDLDASLLHDSRTTTGKIFGLLCDVQEGMTPTELKLFNSAYNRLYDRYGIKISDSTTWKNSKQLSFFKLYEEICSLCNDDEYAPYQTELRNFIDKLYVFFDKKGLRSYLFQTPISLAEILNRKENVPMFIDIVLNLESESDNNKQDIEALVKQSTATYLVTLITNYFKSKHEFTVHYIEEYQRYSASPGVESLVVYMITGNRKRNAATFVISNSPSALLKGGGAANQAIIDNITNYIIGKVEPAAIDMICKNFSLENCEKNLQAISRDKLYSHAFLLKINNQDTTIVRQSLPASIVNSPIFKTRDTEKKEE